jgi:hypothetical protein
MAALNLGGLINHFAGGDAGRLAPVHSLRGRRRDRQAAQRLAQEQRREEAMTLLFIGLIAAVYVTVRIALTYLLTSA